MTFSFVFDPRKYRQLRTSVPPLKFTCSALAKDSLPPKLRYCYQFYEYLYNYKCGKDDTAIFRLPVSDEQAANYSKVIKNPIDLSTIRKKILSSRYTSKDEFKSDVDLMWDNCITYNGQDSEIGLLAARIRMDFDNVWAIHNAIKEPEEPKEALKLLEETQQLFKEARESIKSTYAFPELIQVKSEHPIKQKTSHERAPQVIEQPTEEEMKSPMSTDEKYALAKAIDLMPIELLGQVINILKDHPWFKSDEEVKIPFSEIDNAMLRRIEKYVKANADKENQVRRMYPEKVPAQDQIKYIQAQLDIVTELISHKTVVGESSSAASEGSESDSGESSSSMASSDSDS